MSIKRAQEFLESQKGMYPDCADAYGRFEQLFQQKLWHQLGMAISEHLCAEPTRAVHHPGRILDLYVRFVCEFSEKLNPLLFVEFAVAGVRDMDLKEPGTVDLALKHLREAVEHVKSRTEPDALSATVVAVAVSGDVCVAGGRLGEARTFLDEADATLQKVTGANPSVWAQYYRVCAAYRKARNEPEEFYRAGLCYLSYVVLADVPPQEQYELARDLALAALVGPATYNIGELLASPICERLKDQASTAWLVPLLAAFNRGDSAEFQRLVAAARSDPACAGMVAALQRHEAVLTEKISILALMELVFRQSTTDGGRRIAFADIAKEAGISLDAVETLAIHSMALGLVRGTIDQVDQVFDVQWVQPRVLDKTQLQTMIGMLDEWSNRISFALDTLHQQQQ